MFLGAGALNVDHHMIDKTCEMCYSGADGKLKEEKRQKKKEGKKERRREGDWYEWVLSDR